jgi:sulfur carrier protein
MDIELNGQPHRAKENQSVQDLIEQLDLAHQALAVAVNREVVPRDLWPQRRLQANDKVELVRPIGGG